MNPRIIRRSNGRLTTVLLMAGRRELARIYSTDDTWRVLVFGAIEPIEPRFEYFNMAVAWLEGNATRIAEQARLSQALRPATLRLVGESVALSGVVTLSGPRLLDLLERVRDQDHGVLEVLREALELREKLHADHRPLDEARRSP